MLTMTKKSLLICLWVLLDLGCHARTTLAQGVPPSQAKPLVLLISIDGFKPSYLSQEHSPRLLALARQGVLAQGLISSFPSLTFPNHLTMVTGQTPDHHGIVNNNMTDPRTPQRFSLGSREAVENPFWWQEALPIWVSLRQQGKIASTMFWPGSETSIHGVTPNDWLRYDHDMTHEARLDMLMGWLAREPDRRPDFATLYFSDVDSAGHSAGPESEAVQRAVRKVDRTIGLLFDRLQQAGQLERTTWVIVSDHGMASSPPDKVIPVQKVLSGFAAARWEWQGATAGVRLNGEPLDGVMQALNKLPHASCWPKGQMPARFKFGTHRRIPDIVCLAELGYSVSYNPDRAGPLGQHGYDPELPDMHGLLIVGGHRIQRSALGLVQNVEIHGLLSKLLGVDTPLQDGQGTLHQQLIKP